MGALYLFTRTSRTLLFWAAFVLTRPLGATLGDSLTKPLKAGGLALGAIPSSALLAAVVVLVALAARKPAPSVDG